MLKHTSHDERISRRRLAIKSFKARANANRSAFDTVADWFTSFFGTLFFLGAHVVFFGVWIIWNSGLIVGLQTIDPFPFGLLTTIVSLEAIFLAIVVLISQNRQSRIAELREEVDLFINTYAENEITKVMYLQTLLLEKHGIDVSQDTELKKMLQSLESDIIEEELKKQL